MEHSPILKKTLLCDYGQDLGHRADMHADIDGAEGGGIILLWKLVAVLLEATLSLQQTLKEYIL